MNAVSVLWVEWRWRGSLCVSKIFWALTLNCVCLVPCAAVENITEWQRLNAASMFWSKYTKLNICVSMSSKRQQRHAANACPSLCYSSLTFYKWVIGCSIKHWTMLLNHCLLLSVTLCMCHCVKDCVIFGVESQTLYLFHELKASGRWVLWPANCQGWTLVTFTADFANSTVKFEHSASLMLTFRGFDTITFSNKPTMNYHPTLKL